MLGTDLEVIRAMVTCKGINWNGWDYSSTAMGEKEVDQG